MFGKNGIKKHDLVLIHNKKKKLYVAHMKGLFKTKRSAILKRLALCHTGGVLLGLRLIMAAK